MEKKMRKYTAYCSNIKTLLACSGLWPKSNPVVSRVLAALALFTNGMVALGVFNFCRHHASDIIILTKGMGMVLSMSTSCLKICTFLLHRNDIVYLNNYLTAQHTEDLEDHEDRPSLLNRIVSFSNFLYIQAVAGFLCTFMFSIVPIVAWRKYGKYLHMYPTIYPIKHTPGGAVHWTLYSMEVLAGFFLCCVTSGVDNAFGMYSLQMCGELKILAKIFQSLRVEKNYKEKMKDCIRRHYMLQNAKTKLENLFGFLSIWMAISAGVVLCSLIFQFTEVIKAKAASLSFVLIITPYIILKLLQVFTYAWYGDVIAHESSSCLDAMYNAHWPEEYNSSFRNDIIIVLMQKPMLLKAKGCMFIQLDMFTKILNTSVSYFFLLQTLNEEAQH